MNWFQSWEFFKKEPDTGIAPMPRCSSSCHQVSNRQCGLARYDLGEREQGCEDFTKAIVLGFPILKIAEKDKCAEFWDEE